MDRRLSGPRPFFTLAPPTKGKLSQIVHIHTISATKFHFKRQYMGSVTVIHIFKHYLPHNITTTTTTMTMSSLESFSPAPKHAPKHTPKHWSALIQIILLQIQI